MRHCGSGRRRTGRGNAVVVPPYDEHPMRAHHFERADLVEMLGRWLQLRHHLRGRVASVTATMSSVFEGRPHVERIDYERKLQALRPAAIGEPMRHPPQRQRLGGNRCSSRCARRWTRSSSDWTGRARMRTAERLLATLPVVSDPRQDLLHRQSARDGLRRRAQCDRGCLRRSWILWLDGDELLLEETGLECLLRDNSLDGICRCADRITVTRRRAS
jgi:hypothetical protein